MQERTQCKLTLAILSSNVTSMCRRVVAEFGKAYTQGLQQYSGHEKVVQAVVTLKHFLAYSIEDYDGVQR